MANPVRRIAAVPKKSTPSEPHRRMFAADAVSLEVIPMNRFDASGYFFTSAHSLSFNGIAVSLAVIVLTSLK